MHRIDRLEPLETLSQIRQETKSLLGEIAAERHSLSLRRIIVLLGYMAEHLEMVSQRTRRVLDDGSARPHDHYRGRG
jgi:hypothetical protein